VCRRSWRARSPAISLGLTAGDRSSSRSRTGWQMTPAGPARLRAARRPLINQGTSDHRQSIAGGIPIMAIDITSMPITSTSAPTPTPTSPPSCATSNGTRCRAERGRAQGRPSRRLEQKQFGDVRPYRRGSGGHAQGREPVQIIDARPRHYTTKAQDIMEGAVWRDPNAWINGSASSPRPSRSSPTASTASTSDCETRDAAQGRVRCSYMAADTRLGRRSKAP